jgi:hypothetical protein
MNTYDENTPVGALTVGQLLEIIDKKLAARKPEPQQQPQPQPNKDPSNHFPSTLREFITLLF